ncbi:MAG: radical SAM protein [Patescibacteria group bacterium]|nr:radical SAM protein [Patescibacteria group bacterium]
MTESLNKYYWARYAHMLEKNNMAACFNALKMRPVYLDLQCAKIVKEICNDGATIDDLKSVVSDDSLEEIVQELLCAKVLYDGLPKDVNAGQKFGEIATANTSIQFLYLILTDACNLNCSYCFLRNRDVVHTKGKKMSKEIAKKAAIRFSEQLLSSKIALQFGQIVFYGGEPLLNFSVIEAFVKTLDDIKVKNKNLPSIIYTMTTNATLVTERIAEYLALHNIAVGVSIDGPEKVMTNRRKVSNEDSSNEVLRGISLLKEKGVNLSASCTLTEEVLDNFDEIMRYFLDEIEFKNLSFNMILPDPKGKFNIDYCKKATEAMIKSWELCQLKNANEDRITRKVKAMKSFIPYPYDCAACGSQIFVDPEGNVGLCQGTLGNENKTLCDVFNPFDLEKYKLYQEMRRRTPLLMEKCQSCSAIGICGGGCALAAEAIKGNIYELDERFCIHSKICLEWIIWDKIFPVISKIK